MAPALGTLESYRALVSCGTFLSDCQLAVRRAMVTGASTSSAPAEPAPAAPGPGPTAPSNPSKRKHGIAGG